MSRSLRHHAISPISHPARHARHAHSPDPLAGTGPRLRHRPAAGADFAIRRSSQPGLALSRPPQTGTEAVVESRVETVGDRARGQILFPDKFRTKTARAREK